MNRVVKVKCPSCKKDVYWDDTATYRPFCSKRCQLIDLGQWADESHRIPGDDHEVHNNNETIENPYKIDN